MAKFQAGSPYTILKERNGNNGDFEEDCITLVNPDVQSPSLQFLNESTDNISTEKSKNGVLNQCIQIIKSDKTKTIIAALVTLSYIILICHVVYINFKMKDTRNLLEEEKRKIAAMEKTHKTNTLFDDLERMTKLEGEFETRKAQLDELEESHRTHLLHIYQKHLTHKEQLRNMTDRLQAKEDQIDDIEKTLREHNETLRTGSSDFDNLKGKTLSPVSTNGVLVWKVTNFSRISAIAKSGGPDKFFSDPFYSSQYGYKMCLFINPNGKYLGKDTHLSLYFNLMKGEMDDILVWPFNLEVTIMLIDQSLKENHYERSFWPEVHEIFSKPKTQISPRGWGWQRFISIQDLKSDDIYLRNDTIYIKVIVAAENER